MYSLQSALPWTYSIGFQATPASKAKHRQLTVGALVVQALCPDTTNFIHGTLAPLFENGIAKLMSFRYIAFGKAKHTPEGLQVRWLVVMLPTFQSYLLCTLLLITADRVAARSG